jgi:DNA-binding transcriptional LysR family regulator
MLNLQVYGSIDMNRICFDDIYVFIKVAEHKSITAASVKLGMSKQTISRKISKLEESLSVLLIARTTRSFELTAAGLKYYTQCVDIFNEVEKVNDVITEFHNSPSGTVKLGTPDYFPCCMFSFALTQYMEINPDINIHISFHCKESDLVNNNIDIAFRVGTLNDSSMIARKIGKIKFAYVASLEYLEKQGIPNKIDDLKHHNIIEVNNFHFYDFNSFKQKLTSCNFYFARDFALSGFGLSIIPLCVAYEEIRQGKLIVLEDDAFTIEEDIYIVYLATRHLPGQVRGLIDYLVNHSYEKSFDKISGL